MASTGSHSQSGHHRAPAALVGAVVVAALSACVAPFGFGQPSTRALEDGAAATMAAGRTFEIKGAYVESGTPWSIDLQVGGPKLEHVLVSKPDLKLEATLVGGDAYFRGSHFLSQHMGTDLLSRNLVKAAGNAWWRGSSANVPTMPDLTDADTFRTTFLGTSISKRFDHVAVDGVDAVNLSGPRANVFVAAGAPYQLLRVQLKKGAVVDGISDADFRFSNFDRNFGIGTPKDVIDFSNLSTLPPIYTVLSVDTSACASPCVVSALLKNLGGKAGAQAPSTITLTMKDAASGRAVGTCQATVTTDVGYNATTTVGCTITTTGAQQANAATVTATADNPGRA